MANSEDAAMRDERSPLSREVPTAFEQGARQELSSDWNHNKHDQSTAPKIDDPDRILEHVGGNTWLILGKAGEVEAIRTATHQMYDFEYDGKGISKIFEPDGCILKRDPDNDKSWQRFPAGSSKSTPFYGTVDIGQDGSVTYSGSDGKPCLVNLGDGTRYTLNDKGWCYRGPGEKDDVLLPADFTIVRGSNGALVMQPKMTDKTSNI